MAYLIETKDPVAAVTYTIGSCEVKPTVAKGLIAHGHKTRTEYERIDGKGPFVRRTTYVVSGRA